MQQPYLHSDKFNVNRRRFILNTVKATGGFALLGLQSIKPVIPFFPPLNQLTVQQVIDLILKEGDLPVLKETVDTIKAGSADQVVTGIVTTMFATINVIEKAAKLNANFIIAHEPTFYNHKDDINWVANNSVVKQKLELLDKHKITVWRFHDYCHALKPDAISYGVAKKANWLPYFKTGQSLLSIPSISLLNLAKHLKSTLGIEQLRIIGDPKQICERICLLPGAWGGVNQVTTAETQKPDVLIVGEVSEWETAEYIRDGRLMGSKTSLIVLGHSVSEEPGMEWVADWLQPKLSGIKITHIASGNPFSFV